MMPFTISDYAENEFRRLSSVVIIMEESFAAAQNTAINASLGVPLL